MYSFPSTRSFYMSRSQLKTYTAGVPVRPVGFLFIPKVNMNAKKVRRTNKSEDAGYRSPCLSHAKRALYPDDEFRTINILIITLRLYQGTKQRAQTHNIPLTDLITISSTAISRAVVHDQQLTNIRHFSSMATLVQLCCCRRPSSRYVKRRQEREILKHVASEDAPPGCGADG
jgi:hypothetical protein